MPELVEPVIRLDEEVKAFFHPDHDTVKLFVFLTSTGGGFIEDTFYIPRADVTKVDPSLEMTLGTRVSDMEWYAAVTLQLYGEDDPVTRSLPRGYWSATTRMVDDIDGKETPLFLRGIHDQVFIGQLAITRSRGWQ
jgi:hypothetical protein